MCEIANLKSSVRFRDGSPIIIWKWSKGRTAGSDSASVSSSLTFQAKKKTTHLYK